MPSSSRASTPAESAGVGMIERHPNPSESFVLLVVAILCIYAGVNMLLWVLL